MPPPSLPYPRQATPEHLRTTDPRRRDSAGSASLASLPSPDPSPQSRDIAFPVEGRSAIPEVHGPTRRRLQKRKRGRSPHPTSPTTPTSLSAIAPPTSISPASALTSGRWSSSARQEVIAAVVVRGSHNEQEFRRAYGELQAQLQELSEKYEAEVREKEALRVRLDAETVRVEALRAEMEEFIVDNERKEWLVKEAYVAAETLPIEIVKLTAQRELSEIQRADDQAEVKRLRKAHAKLKNARLKLVQRVYEHRERERGVRERLTAVVGGSTKSADVCDLADKVVKRLRTMDNRLETEKRARRTAEKQMDVARIALNDVETECREPFVVPALLDAMVSLSSITREIVVPGEE